ELDPVELDVLPRGEMAVAAVIFARDMGKLPQLVRRQRAVGDRDAEHVGVQLQIDPVLEPQDLELVLGELAGEAAFHLVAEFQDALVDERAVDFIVSVHLNYLAACLRPAPASRWSRLCDASARAGSRG